MILPACRCIENKRKGEATWSLLKFVLEAPVTLRAATNQVNVKGAFCMQVCTQGLGLRVNGKQLLGVGLHNVREVLEQEITAALA